MPKAPTCNCANPKVTLVKSQPWGIPGEHSLKTGRREHYKCDSCDKEFDLTYTEKGLLIDQRTKNKR